MNDKCCAELILLFSKLITYDKYKKNTNKYTLSKKC